MRRLLRRTRRGQAMAEYSLITFFLIGMTTVTLIDLLPRFIDSYQKYIDGFYILLNLPIP